jgi:flagellar motor protein MotB
VAAALLVAAGCETPREKELLKDKAELQATIVQYEKNNQDLLARVEEANVRARRAEIALDGRERQITALRDAMTELHSTVRLAEKTRTQLEILADRFGGQLIDNRLLLPGDFFFASGQWKLRPEAGEVVREVAEILQGQDLTLMIVGHTDSEPVNKARKRGIEDNRHLSLMRALSVMQELETNGYPAEKMYPTGWGPLKPIAENETPVGKALNRRVEIYIDPGMSNLSFGGSAIMGIDTSVGGEGPIVEEVTAPFAAEGME